MDKLHKDFADYLQSGTQSKDHKKTVLFAPTWGKNNLLRTHALRPIRALAESGYHVIIRPHPQSYISEEKLLNNLVKELEDLPNVEWDKSTNNLKSMSRADILVSNLSGIIFDFALILQKPVITVIHQYDFSGQDANDLEHKLWETTILDHVGHVVHENNIADLGSIIDMTLNENKDTINYAQLRSDNIYNFGLSGEIISKQLVEISKRF